MDHSKFLFDGEYLINVNADSSVVLPLGDTFDIDVPFTDGPNGRVMRLYKNGTGEYRIKKDGKFLERKFSHTLFKYKRTKKYLTIYYDDYSKEIYYINHGRINTCTYIAAQFERQMLGEIGVPVYRPTALDMGTHVAKGKLFKLKHSQNRMIYETLLSVCGIFIILGLILNFLGDLNKRCNYSGCKEYKTYNSSYCIKHTKKTTGYTYSSGSSKNNSKKETKTYNTSSKSSGSKYYDSDYYNTKSYKSGEEFADDWADDFDEDDYDDYDEAWDEAYDYWNDN